jgi:hypothetical protein
MPDVKDDNDNDNDDDVFAADYNVDDDVNGD